jgi:hypothetical protein
MKLHGPPFDSVIEEMVYNIVMGGEALAFESISVGYNSLVSLGIPNNPLWKDKLRYCQIILEADATTTTKTKAIRFVEVKTEAGSLTVNAAEVRAKGLPLGDLGVYEIKGVENMANFRAIGLEASKTHFLRVQYYG